MPDQNPKKPFHLDIDLAEYDMDDAIECALSEGSPDIFAPQLASKFDKLPAAEQLQYFTPEVVNYLVNSPETGWMVDKIETLPSVTQESVFSDTGFWEQLSYKPEFEPRVIEMFKQLSADEKEAVLKVNGVGGTICEAVIAGGPTAVMGALDEMTQKTRISILMEYEVVFGIMEDGGAAGAKWLTKAFDALKPGQLDDFFKDNGVEPFVNNGQEVWVVKKSETIPNIAARLKGMQSAKGSVPNGPTP